MLTFIATDLQLYKIFNIKQDSFFGTQCNEFTFIVDDGLLNGVNVYLMLWGKQNTDSSDCTVQRLSSEQYDCHVTGRMADIFFLLHALHYTFLRAIATPGIRRYFL